jgi:hypothetical protein
MKQSCCLLIDLYQALFEFTTWITRDWVQINPNLSDYHSDPLKMISSLCMPDITDWWRQQKEMHSLYTDLSNVACNIISVIQDGVQLEASFSLGWDAIVWRQSKPTDVTRWEPVIVRRFAGADHRILAGDYPALYMTNTEINTEIKKDAKLQKLHWMANIHDFVRCGRATKSHMLCGRNLALNTRKWQLWDTFRIQKRSSKHPGHSFHMRARLH